MANKGSNNGNHGQKPIFCSFCGRLRQEVDKLIEGPNSVYICDECVEICHKIMLDEEGASQENIMGSKDLISTDWNMIVFLFVFFNSCIKFLHLS